jgi:hypothetical protein
MLEPDGRVLARDVDPPSIRTFEVGRGADSGRIRKASCHSVDRLSLTISVRL